MTVPESPKDRDRVVRDALAAIRALSDAMDRMHGDMKGDMDMNATDLAALRMLIMREQRGELVSPHDLADHLRISSASTTKLVDRLAASGHVERRAHPHDGRARVISLTELSRHTFHRHFRERLAAMKDVADGYGTQELALVSRFLEEVGDAIDPR